MRVLARDFRLSILGGVALACLGLAPGAAAVRTPAPVAALSIPDAWKACNANKIAPADRIAHCTTIIDYRHTKPDARALALTARGFGHIAQKDNDAALADFEAAIRTYPKLATAYFYRGAMLTDRDPKRALADLDKAISLEPNNALSYRQRSVLYHKARDYPRAIADLTTAIGLAKNPKSEYFLRAATYEDMGEKEKAIADFQASLALDPDDDVIRRHLAAMGGAIPEAAQLPPGDCSAGVIAHEERITGCTAVIDSGKLSGWTLKVAYCNRGYSLTELQQYDDVIADSNKLISLMPDSACAYLNRARGWYFKHDLDRAIADYTRSIEYDARMHEAHASRGTAYFDRKDFGRAIADYDRAITIDGSVPMYFSDRGNTRFRMGEYDRAIADYTSALELDAEYAQAYTRRGWAYLQKGDLERAEADFAKALELAPGDTYARSGREQLRKRQGKAEDVPDRGEARGLNFEKFRRLVQQPRDAAVSK